MTKAFVGPSLDADVIERMRAPPDIDDGLGLSDDEDTSGDEGNEKKNCIPGSFRETSIGDHNAGSYY